MSDLKDAADVINQLAELHAIHLVNAQDLTIAGVPVSVTPPGYSVKLHPELNERPTRTKRNFIAHTAESFIEYVNRFADESTIVFVDLEKGKAIAVIDYDEPSDIVENGARWGDHTCTYTFPRGKEASDWLAYDGKKMPQTDFALFVEQHLPEIIDPPGAEMLEVALTLQASNNVDFRNAIRLDNGQTQITYAERIEGSAGITGQLKIPSEFTLALQFFKGGDAYQITAKLRYRIKDANLTMWYDLLRPQTAIDEAISQVAQLIKASLEHGKLVFGTMGERT